MNEKPFLDVCVYYILQVCDRTCISAKYKACSTHAENLVKYTQRTGTNKALFIHDHALFINEILCLNIFTREYVVQKSNTRRSNFEHMDVLALRWFLSKTFSATSK